MKARKPLLMILCAILLLLSACSSGSGEGTTSASSSSSSSSEANGNAAADSQESFVMRVAHTLSAASPRHVALMEFEKRIEEATNGKIEVELFHSNSVGDNNQLLQAVPLGSIEAAVQPTSFFGGVEKKLGVLDLPFLFKDIKHLESFATSEDSEEILKLIEPKGMTGLAFWPLGIQVLTSSKPIDSPDALKGQKFRTMGTPVQLDLFSSWGTNPQAIALSELYSSLQQGVIDGQSNDVGTIHDTRLYEVQKHMLLTNHGAIVDLFYVNKSWFDSLPADYQKLLKDTAKELAKLKTEEEVKVIDQKFQAIKDTGKMEIQEPSAEMLDWLKKQAETVVKSFLDEYPDMASVVDKMKAQ